MRFDIKMSQFTCKYMWVYWENFQTPAYFAIFSCLISSVCIPLVVIPQNEMVKILEIGANPFLLLDMLNFYF